MEYNKKIAIFDPFTKFEFDSGIVESTLETYLNKLPSSEYCFDMFYLYNTGDNEMYRKLKSYEEHPNINKIILANQNIPPEYDTYHKNCILEYNGAELKHEILPCPDYLPPLGGTSGPNLSFYIAIDMMITEMYEYEHYFMIENDSFPVKEGWFDLLLGYIDTLDEDYLIAGSRYKGHQKWHHVLEYKDHLNGIAIYKNDPRLLKFIQSGRQYHESIVNRDNWSVNFDIALDQFSKTLEGRELTNDTKALIDTPLITNVSDPLDSYMTVEDILTQAPETVIVHQKDYLGLDPARTPYIPDLSDKFPPDWVGEENIPFFLRTPRVAGNFVLRYASKQLNEWCIERDLIPYFFKVDMQMGASCDVFLCASEPMFDANEWIQYRQGIDPYPPNRLDYGELLHEVNDKDLQILLISNDPFVKNLSAREIIYKMRTICDELSYYTLMREPFERTKSLCRFNTDDQFLNYIESAELQDSWVIRTLCNLDFKREIEYFHYEYAYNMLKHFDVRDISQAKQLVDGMLELHYGIEPREDIDTIVEPRYYRKSQTKTNFKQQDLKKYKYVKNPSINLHEIYTGRTYFEEQLYNNLINSSTS